LHHPLEGWAEWHGGTHKLPPAEDATSMAIDTIVLNTTDTDLIPVGARFTVAGETAPQVHIVQTRTPAAPVPRLRLRLLQRWARAHTPRTAL